MRSSFRIPRCEFLGSGFRGRPAEHVDVDPEVQPVRGDAPARVLNLRTRTSQKCAAVRSGLVFNAHRRLYHPTLGLRVIKKKQFKGFKEKSTTLHRTAAERFGTQ